MHGMSHARPHSVMGAVIETRVGFAGAGPDPPVQVQVGRLGEVVGGAVAPGDQWSCHGSALKDAGGSAAQCNNYVV